MNIQSYLLNALDSYGFFPLNSFDVLTYFRIFRIKICALSFLLIKMLSKFLFCSIFLIYSLFYCHVKQLSTSSVTFTVLACKDNIR